MNHIFTLITLKNVTFTFLALLKVYYSLVFAKNLSGGTTAILFTCSIIMDWHSRTETLSLPYFIAPISLEKFLRPT